MKLRLVISGGQTGADRTGLECARDVGLRTGGTAPKGWKTDEGPTPDLADFGLVQSHSADYAIRTRQNVNNAEATLWFGKTSSPGYWCTRKACKDYGRPLIENPTAVDMPSIADTYEIVNIAGNRRRLYPAVVEMVRAAFEGLREALGR